MPIVAVVAGVVVIFAAMKLGTVVGADAALAYRFIALGALALCAFLVIWLHHRRKSEALIHARYNLKADELRWQKVSLIGRKDARICAECGALTVDFWTMREHVNWHEQLAELIAAGTKDEQEEPPWTAVTEQEEARSIDATHG